MTDFDRTNLLRALDARHEDLLDQLEALNEQIEKVLTASRPPVGQAFQPDGPK